MNDACPECGTTISAEKGTIGPAMAGFNNQLDVVVPEQVHLAECPKCGAKRRRMAVADVDPPAWESVSTD